MWNSITGFINKKGDDFIHLQSGNYEWEFSVSGYTLSKLPRAGTETRIFTFLQHSQDLMKIYGFSDEAERKVFLELIKVGGIGPKGALKILSGISPDGFMKALDDGDVDGLCRLPGLGKKTAQKIVLSLRGKLSIDDEKPENKDEHSEIVDSLVNMGFDRKQAKEAVKTATLESSEAGKIDEGEIFRQALIILSS